MSRDELKAWGKNDLIREIHRLRALLDEQMSAAPGIGEEVTVQGIVAVSSGKPVVSMRAGEAAWQMTPAGARQHALVVLDAAVEAERDAATVAFLREMGEASGQAEEEQIRTAAGFLQQMREHRDNWLEQMRSGA